MGVVLLQLPPRRVLRSAAIVPVLVVGAGVILPLTAGGLTGGVFIFVFAAIFASGKRGAIALLETKSLNPFPAALGVPSYFRSCEKISQFIFSISVIISYSELFLSPSI